LASLGRDQIPQFRQESVKESVASDEYNSEQGSQQRDILRQHNGAPSQQKQFSTP